MSPTVTHKLLKPLKPLHHLITNPQFLLPYVYSITHYSSTSSQDHETVTKLISIFTTQHPHPQSDLTSLQSKLTPIIVETTLKSFKNWETALTFFNWASNQNQYRPNCYTYNVMAYILSGVRQNAAMKKLCVDLVNSRCNVSPGALSCFIRCLGELGMGNEANELFDQVRKMGCVPNECSYNSLLEVISKSGLVELVDIKMDEMRDNGWKPSKSTLISVLKCYCSAGKFEKVLKVFHQIDELYSVDSYVYSLVIISLIKASEVNKVINLIEKIDDFKISLNENMFYDLIHGFVKNGKVDYALTLLKKMQTLGFVPRVSLYAVLAEGFCKRKEFTKAVQLYSQMNETGIHPDVNLLKILISCLPDEKDIIFLLKEAKGYVNKKSMTFLVNSALTNLVNSGSIGSIDNAYNLLREIMKDETNFVFLDASSFVIVIDGLCAKGELCMAEELFNIMDQIGCKKSLLLYNNLIDAFSNAKKVEKSHELLTDMKENGILPSQFTHNSIFGYYCKTADVAGALNVLREMRTHGHQPWIKHYTLLVKKLSVNRNVAEACSFMEMMMEIGFMPDMIAYSAVIDGWFKIGEVDYALKMFKDIFARGYFPDVVTYNTIISGLCKAKRVSESHEIYNEMVQKSLIPSVVTYNLLIDAYCKNNEIDKAVGFFSKMAEKNRNPNVVTYSTLIDGLCNSGKSDEALLIWNEMVCLPNEITFMALINGLCKCRKPDVAFGYFEEMQKKNMRPDTYVYVALLNAFIHVSNAPMALCVFKKMIRDKKLPDLADKNCVSISEAVVKLLDDELTSSDIAALIADGNIPVHLLQTHV